MKRFWTVFLVISMLMSTAACASEPQTQQVPASGGRSVFADVPDGAEYADAVEWCYAQGLMNGVGEGRFDPDGTLTRAMLATVLYRAKGEPPAGGAMPFTDAAADAWYSNALIWANGEKLIQGYGDGVFGVNDPVSEEQLSVIIDRYLGKGDTWTGDPDRANAATRAQVAAALMGALKGNEEDNMEKVTVSFNGHTYTATLAERNSTVDAFVKYLKDSGGAVTISAHDYGGWEKVGGLGTDLGTAEDVRTSTIPGDFVLYTGNQIVLFYGSNSWSYTRLGHLDGDLSNLKSDLGSGDVSITFSVS